MKYLLLALALISFGATAQTVINYDDGSTLTLVEGEMIHVTKGKLYQKRTYNSGRTIQFKEFPETTRRDYVEVDTGTDDDMVMGSPEWCEAYIPWSEGLTFNMVAWQRACDTNGDGVYNQCDYYQPTGAATFEELAWQDQCNDCLLYTSPSPRD